MNLVLRDKTSELQYSFTYRRKPIDEARVRGLDRAGSQSHHRCRWRTLLPVP